MNGAGCVILSCEHAGNRVPQRYRHLFAGQEAVLKTHRGYDIGIAPVAEQLRQALDCPLWRFDQTRLLIDVNRTRSSTQFSAFSAGLDEQEKRRLIAEVYGPYRERLKQAIAERLGHKPVLHLALHSFTPELDGRRRNAEVGILYDPRRSGEAAFARRLQDRLRERTTLRVRRNYPYLGRADGMTTWLRKQFGPGQYWGIELELNQAFLKVLNRTQRTDFVNLLADCLRVNKQLR